MFRPVGDPQILADQLTLSQPGVGGILYPQHYYCPFQIFRPSYGPHVRMRTQIGTQITVEKKAGNLRAYPKTALDVFYEIQFVIFTSDITT